MTVIGAHHSLATVGKNPGAGTKRQILSTRIPVNPDRRPCATPRAFCISILRGAAVTQARAEEAVQFHAQMRARWALPGTRLVNNARQWFICVG
jgi:hypothetical protein